ncbi:uncharacterized protein [Musca autumnalis]|uniref:uncharacterized protein n=1 Tax=Musca autumnalis TaxID=221902 RepID=UPI003CEDFA36
MLSGRIINSNIGETSIRKSVTRGTPQGGVLSPLLWLLVINEILKEFDQLRIKTVAYADDVVIMITGKFPQTLSELMQGALVKLSRWAHNNGLGVNPSKTELVLFTNKRKVKPFTLPTLDGVALKLSLEAKYLDIILDHQLTWKRNVEERAKRGLIALYSCKNSIGKSWGLKPQVIHWIFTAIVRPILTYGSLVWWNALSKTSLLHKINTVQRAASLLITGAMKSTPQAALNVLLDLHPMNLVVQDLAAKSALRLKEISSWRNFDYGHAVILRRSGLSVGLEVINDYISPQLHFDDIEVRIPDREAWTHNSSPLPGIEVYTDGSKMEGGTGAGVYSDTLNLRISYKLSENCSVFQAEIFAVTKAAELIKNMEGDIAGPVTIYVDSQAALKSLRSHSIKSAAALHCRKALEALRSIVTLCWVPGHCDIEGNEKADEMARRGSESNDIEFDNSIKPPLCHFMRLLEQAYREKAGQIWNNEPGCKVSKAIWPNLSKRKTTSLLSMRKPDLKLMVGTYNIINPTAAGSFVPD